MACRLFSLMGYGVGVGQGHSNNPRVVVSVLPIPSLPSHTLPRTPHLHHLGLPLFPRVLQRGAKHLASPVQSSVEMEEEEYVPTPVVIIDQDSDPEATIVEMSYGDRLGALLDTMKTLQNMGLNVVRGQISIEGGTTWKRFAITRNDTGRKIEDPMLLEAIRLAIISNMLVYHPESSAKLAMGNIFGTKPSKKLDKDIATHIRIQDDGPERSLLLIETADEPGLLGEIVKIITDVNVNFDSGEFDTEGLVAKSKFHVNYAGVALSKSLQEVLINSLRYYLRRPQTNDESY